MITTAKFIDVEKYEIELTMKMTVADWRAISGDLSQRWPSGELSRHIDEAVSKLTRSVLVTPTGSL